MSSSLQFSVDECSIESIIKQEKFTFTWNIKNFGDVLDRRYEICSPIFSANCSAGGKWRMVLFPSHQYPEGANASVNLMKMTEDGISHSVKYTVYAMGKGAQKICHTREKVFRKYLDFDTCSIASHSELTAKKFLVENSLVICCEMDILMNENLDEAKYMVNESFNINEDKCSDFNAKQCNNFIEDDKLWNNMDTYNCNMHKEPDTHLNNLQKYELLNFSKSLNSMDKSFKHINIPDDNVSQSSLNHLSQSLNHLYLSKSHYDVIINVNGTDVLAHKAILCARSTYFKKIFETCKDEKIFIAGIRKDMFDIIFLYIYTGQVPVLTSSLALEMVHATTKFNLEFLHQLVIEYLKSHINLDNVIDILQACEDFKLDDLKFKALKFVSSNHADLVNKGKWDTLIKNNPHIAGEALLTVSYSKKQNK